MKLKLTIKRSFDVIATAEVTCYPKALRDFGTNKDTEYAEDQDDAMRRIMLEIERVINTNSRFRAHVEEAGK